MSTQHKPAETAQRQEVQALARAFLVESELADAIVVLDRNLRGGDKMEPVAADLCARAGVDPKDADAVHELLNTLGARLAEMTGGRSEAFESALEAWPEEERFSVAALADVLWPTLENLRAAGRTDVESFRSEVARHEPALRALYLRHSGRSERAWQLTWQALHQRLPRLFARHAELMGPVDPGALQKLAATPEGVAVLTGALGLLTLRMGVSTPLVMGVLAVVGYAGLAPLVERMRGRIRNLILATLADEDRVVRQDAHLADLSLRTLLDQVRPILFTALLAGVNGPEELRAQVALLLDEFRQRALEPGGPGAAYANAVEEVVLTKYVPRLAGVAEQSRAVVEAGLARRVISDPHGAGLVAATVTLPLSYLAARATPFGLWDLPLMVGLFYGAGRTVSGLLLNPRRALGELEEAMDKEQRVLASLYSARTALPGPEG